MSKDTGFDARDLEWNSKGFGKDIEYESKRTNQSKANGVQESSCGNVMGFVSSLQEISVQENLLDDSIDKNLFTLHKTFCALKVGMNLGFASSVTIILHILFCYLFSYHFVIDFFKNNQILGMFLKYMPAIVTIAVSIYIANLSKYAVGDYTARAIKTFFIGKMTSTVVVGFFIFVSFVYLEALLLKISFNNSMLYAKYMFYQNITATYYITVVLILISSFLPFLFYGLRKLLFSSNEKTKYDEY